MSLTFFATIHFRPEAALDRHFKWLDTEHCRRCYLWMARDYKPEWM